MIVSDLIKKAFLTATGKVANFDDTDKKWTKLLQIANIQQQVWATEPSEKWASLYEDIDLGNITATNTFDLDDSIQSISMGAGDEVRIEKDGTIYRYPLVPVDELSLFDNAVARVGSTLRFAKAFTADDTQFGGKLIVPAYVYPPELKRPTDKVRVDDPNWLVFMTPAEWVRNDLTLAQNYPNLISLANNSMQGMKQANRSQRSTLFKLPATRNVRSW